MKRSKQQKQMRMNMEKKTLLPLGLALLQGVFAAEVTVAGPWSIRVTDGEKKIDIPVERQPLVQVTGEKAKLPVYNPNMAGWLRGRKFAGVAAQECTIRYAIVAGSIEVTDQDGREFSQGADFSYDTEWGCIGRLEGGAIKEGQDVLINYRYAPKRLDSVFVNKDGKYIIRKGVPHVANPFVPEAQEGEQRIANIYMNGKTEALTFNNIFPILEQDYPEKPADGVSIAEKMLPKFMKKLKSGEKVRIMAWGDSVTVATFLPDWKTQAWFAVFFKQLQEKYPNAQMELLREAWGGRTTTAYLAEPTGAEHNYQEKVLAPKADLYVSEFVNDASINSAELLRGNYERIHKDFQEIGAEWIIMTPHYVRPDWMGLDSERDIDEDPRPYVRFVRQFGAEKGIPIAEGAKRYGHLWREGIPYTVLMLNGINHPNPFGQKLLGDSVFEIFK